MLSSYNHAILLVWGVGIIFGILTLIAHLSKKKVLESEENQVVSNRVDNVLNVIDMELGVPSTAVKVDLLTFAYKLKNGEPVAKERGMMTTPYVNFEYKLFVENGNIYIVDTDTKYVIDGKSIKGISTVNKRIGVVMWNKEISFKDGVYKPYKISSNDNGIFFKPYHILKFEHNGELWGIWFPCYELPVFEHITGLRAE